MNQAPSRPHRRAALRGRRCAPGLLAALLWAAVAPPLAAAGPEPSAPVAAEPAPRAGAPGLTLHIENPQAREACRLAQEELRAGRRRASLESFRRGLRIDPERVECRAGLATLLLREFHWREAEAEFRAALARASEPQQREILLVGLGEALERRGDVEMAVRAYEDALRLVPESPQALGHLAIARRLAGDLDGAISAWKSYLDRQPRDSAAVERLEEVLRLQAELRLLEKETQGEDGAAAAWDALARSRRAAGDAQGALAARRRAAALSPKDPERALALAVALVDTGHRDESVQELERVLSLERDRTAAYAHLARLAEAAGDGAAERRVWERLLAERPMELVALRRIVEIDQRTGSLDGAVDGQARRARREARDPGAALHLALSRAAAGDAPGAQDAFALALERAPVEPSVQAAVDDFLSRTGGLGTDGARPAGKAARRRRAHSEPGAGSAAGSQSAAPPSAPQAAPDVPAPAATDIGRALLEARRAALRGRPGGAVEHLAALVVRHPRRADLHVALAEALAGAGRAADARREFMLALETDPEQPAAELGLALLALGGGDLGEAERRARAALERRPRDSGGLSTLCAALYRQGRMQEAAEAAQAALRADPWERQASLRFVSARAMAARGDLRAAEEVVLGFMPRAGWIMYDLAWEFARGSFLQERPESFWESWRRRPGQLGGEEEALARIADLLSALEEPYTRLRAPAETIERYFSRQPDSPELVAGKTPEANRSVIARRLQENLAYLRVADFQSPEIAAIVRQILEEFRDAPGLVLDLRGNPGGLQDEARKVAEMLLPPGTPLEVEERRDGAAVVRSGPEGGLYTDRPLVVLVDEGTGSAAEALASALKGSGRATVVGDSTRGKGVSQAVRLLPGGFSILITAGQSFDTSGRPLQGRGVEPDPAPPSPSTADPALDRARDLLAPPR